MVINGNFCSFLASLREKPKKLPRLLLSVTFGHGCGYLETEEEGCLYAFVEVRCCKRPPGDADMILSTTACVFPARPGGSTVEQARLHRRQEVESAAHEGTLLHYNTQVFGHPPDTLRFFSASSPLTS